MVNYTGEELYTFELAQQLQKNGHRVYIYALKMGLLGQKLAEKGIRVFTDLKKIPKPDIVQGHHLFATAQALDYFTDTPAIFICHNHTEGTSLPPHSNRIINTFGVSQVCCTYLYNAGFAETQVGLLENFVDTERFRPRSALPATPTRAAVFSNYATWDGYLPSIQAACDAQGLSLEVIGSGVGNRQPNPELILGEFDIVFAKARAALEALAIGNAVILCDFAGVGEMVGTQNFDRLKPLNFGFAALTQRHDVNVICRELQKYNPQESATVSQRVRAETGLGAYITKLESIYNNTLEAPFVHETKRLYTWRLRLIHFFLKTWLNIPIKNKIVFKRIFRYPVRATKQMIDQLLLRNVRQ